jgi:hypothetical protein
MGEEYKRPWILIFGLGGVVVLQIITLILVIWLCIAVL